MVLIREDPLRALSRGTKRGAFFSSVSETFLVYVCMYRRAEEIFVRSPCVEEWAAE